MTRVAEPPAADPADAAQSRDPRDESLLQTLLALWRELPGLLSDRVHLLALELERAGIAFAAIVALTLAALVFAATAWLALWAGLAGALLHLGLDWGWVFLVVLALNLGGAALVLLRVRALAHLLTLPATVRRLTAAPALVTGALHPAHEAHSRDGAGEPRPAA